MRFIIVAAAAFFAAVAAAAEERITKFDVAIEVAKNGDIEVAESIDIIAEQVSIQRGIFRDLPRVYLKGAQRVPYGYDVISVTRDGTREKYDVESEHAVFRIRIGDADVLLPPGAHSYVLRYRVRNQVRRFSGYDEVYWNATGNFWQFPIETARASVRLPGGAPASQIAAYTGREGEAGKEYVYARQNGAHVFTAARGFAPGEGITVAVGFSKGVVDPLSASAARAE